MSKLRKTARLRTVSMKTHPRAGFSAANIFTRCFWKYCKENDKRMKKEQEKFYMERTNEWTRLEFFVFFLIEFVDARHVLHCCQIAMT